MPVHEKYSSAPDEVKAALLQVFGELEKIPFPVLVTMGIAAKNGVNERQVMVNPLEDVPDDIVHAERLAQKPNQYLVRCP